MKSMNSIANGDMEKALEERGYIMESINSANILTSPLYQRVFDEKKVKHIVDDFDERIANEPKLSFRDGNYYVFDGQHTIAARKEKNRGKDLNIICKVFYDMTEEDEALLFALQTGYSSKPTPGITLRAKLLGCDGAAIAFTRATKSVGIQPSFSGVRGAFRLRCINTAWKAYRRVGELRYIEALTLIVGAWGGHPDSLLLEVVNAMCDFVHAYYGEYDHNALVGRLGYTDPYRLVLIARDPVDRDAGKKKAVSYILNLYNEGRTTDALPVRF